MDKPKRYKTRDVMKEHTLERTEEAIERICNEELKNGWVLVTSVPRQVDVHGCMDSICLVFAQY